MSVASEAKTIDGGLLTETEAAKFLRISPRKLWGLANEKRIPRVKIGHSVRYDPADLRAFAESCKTVA